MPKVAQHIVEARRERAAALLREHKYLDVADVAERLGVSHNTARRDLAALAERSQIKRTFGGAVGGVTSRLDDWNQRFESFAGRLDHAAEGKRRIARKAARLVEAGMTVYIDAGSTLAIVADELAARPPAEVTIVTGSLAVAERLGGTELTVRVLGGRLLARQAALLDESTVEAAGAFDYDVALLGAEAFDASGAWNTLGPVVELQRRVMGRSVLSALCCDATKCGRRAPALLTNWDEIDGLLTDATPAALRKAGIDAGIKDFKEDGR